MKWDRFKKWLEERGCEILPATNPWEELRWQGMETGVIYTSGKYSGPYVAEAILCFKTGKDWNGGPISTNRRGSYTRQKKSLLKRDGDLCFYCQEKLNRDITVEHLKPLTAGGSNKLSNMVLMHKSCNNDLGEKPLHEKVKIIIDFRVNKQLNKSEKWKNFISHSGKDTPTV